MHCNNYLRLVSGLGFVRVRVRIRVKVWVSVMIRVSIRTSWVVNFALFRCYRPVMSLTDNSRTGHLADWTSRGLDNSRIPPATLGA